jgi:hypothetical protein
MQYITWNGKLEPTYHLLHNGIKYPIPLFMSTEKAHKKLDRELHWKARKEEIVSYVETNAGMVHLAEFCFILSFIVWLFS